jgi:hypothetical protein
MAGRECHHCKQWIEQGEPHDCWTTTEAALTRDLPEDLREAWERLRETAATFGPQRIYASGHAIMFSRKSCYFFVRPKKQYLEVCVFLGRKVKAPQVHRVDQASKTKVVHVIRVKHRDEVEQPVTAWLREAYEVSDALSKGDPRVNSKQKPDKKAAAPTKKDGPAPNLNNRVQIERVRRICTSIPGTTEKLSHGEPTFFTPKRVFAMFANNHHGDGHVAVWVPAAPGVQAMLIAEAPDTYFRPPYVGVAGWVGVELSRVDDEQLGAVIREAFRVVTSKKIASDHSGSSRNTRTRRSRASRE